MKKQHFLSKLKIIQLAVYCEVILLDALVERIGAGQFALFAMESWGLVFLGILLFYQLLRYGDRREYRMLYLSLNTATFAYNFFDALSVFINGSTSAAGTFTLWYAYFMRLFFAHCVLLTFTLAYRFVSHRFARSAFLRCLVGTVWVIEVLAFAALILTQFTGALYYFDSSNYYHRGPEYDHYAIMMLFGTFVSLFALIVGRKKIEKHQFKVLFVFCCCTLVGQILSLFFYGARFINLSLLLASIFVFVFEEIEESSRRIEDQKKLSELKLQLMTSQIKPHFIFNSLQEIWVLCYSDPEKAAFMVENFSVYLRKNLDALRESEPVSVEEEMMITDKFLSLVTADEACRFRLEYDIEDQDFLLPPFTLQPLVENALKHGINKHNPDSMIMIRSYENKSSHIIEVSDNATLVKEEIRQAGEHNGVGIENVRTRLSQLCGGTLSVKQENGKTTAVIAIPKE